MDGYTLFVDALSFNESIDFSFVLSCIGIYILFFWFSVAFWVYTDAKKRYQNTRTAFWISFAVFILFFPALILYIAIRKPILEENFLYDDYEIDQGVNIPVINFRGEDEVTIALELNIRKPSRMSRNKDMKVSVDWVSKDENFEIQQKIEKLENQKEKSDIVLKPHFLQMFLRKVKLKIKSLQDKIKSKKESNEEKKPDKQVEPKDTEEKSDVSKHLNEQKEESKLEKQELGIEIKNIENNLDQDKLKQDIQQSQQENKENKKEEENSNYQSNN